MSIDILELKNVIGSERLKTSLDLYSEEAFQYILKSLKYTEKDSWRFYFENSCEFTEVDKFICQSSFFCEEVILKLFTDIIIPCFNNSENISHALSYKRYQSYMFLLTFKTDSVPIHYKPKIFIGLYYKELLGINPNFPEDLLKFLRELNFVNSTCYFLSNGNILNVKPEKYNFRVS